MGATDWIINGGILSILTMVVGFFLRKWIKDTEGSIKEIREDVQRFKDESELYTTKAIKNVIIDFTKITEHLEAITEGMNKNIQSMEKLVSIMEVNIKAQYEATEKEIKSISAWTEELDHTVRKHDNAITRIETTCSYHHEGRKRTTGKP